MVDDERGVGLLSTFLGALKSESGHRRKTARQLGLHPVAMRVGRSGVGGVAPILGRGGKSVGAWRRQAAVPGEGLQLLAAATRLLPKGGQLAPLSWRDDKGEVYGDKTVPLPTWQSRLFEHINGNADHAAMKPSVRLSRLDNVSFAPRSKGMEDERMRAFPEGKADVNSLTSLPHGVSLHSSDWQGETSALHQDFVQTYGVRQITGLVPDQFGGGAGRNIPGHNPVIPPDIDQALDDYFFRKSRLPPAGGAAFNPFLSPIWAGMKIPG